VPNRLTRSYATGAIAASSKRGTPGDRFGRVGTHGSHLGPYCYPKVIDALATGKVDVKPLLTDAYPIAEFDRAMQASLSGGVLKNLIVP